MNDTAIPEFKIIPAAFNVGAWRVDAGHKRLSDGDREVELETRALELLLCLARRPGEPITREQLERELWGDAEVSKDALGKIVSKLRKALGDNHRNPSYIETLPRVGYRLIADVTPGAGALPEDEPEPPRRYAGYVMTAVAVLIAAVFAWIVFKPAPTPAVYATAPEPVVERTPYRPSLAVLPFTSPGNKSVDRHLAHIVTDGLIADLSRLSSLQVVARDVVFNYEDTAIATDQIARELDVRYLVEGSVHNDEGEVRVDARLVDTSINGHVWAGRYIGESSALFVLRDQVFEQLLEVLSVHLSDFDRQRLTRSPLREPDATD